MGNGKLRDVKFSLDEETITFLEMAALSRKESKSAWLRQIPTLLTPEEREFIMRFRETVDRPQDDRNTVGRIHVTQD